VTATRVAGIYFEIVIKPEMEPFLWIPDFKLQKKKIYQKGSFGGTCKIDKNG